VSATPAIAPPGRDALASLLDQYAPLTPVDLCPGLRAFHARSLVEVWQAAEAIAGGVLPAPFWAYPWPAGVALARGVRDHPDWVRGGRVLDIGAGGGVSAVACSLAGAAEVVANDIDPWAVAVASLAAERQGVTLNGWTIDWTAEDPRASAGMDEWDVVLCGDLAYERGRAASQRALLRALRDGGARVIVANAERAYFDPAGLEPLATWTLPVPKDLEGVDVRRADVYSLP
jgi:predicted nicotinamide N-methyase